MKIIMTEGYKRMLWRKQNGIKLKQISSYIGISIPMISMFENGKAYMSHKNIALYDKFIKEYSKLQK